MTHHALREAPRELTGVLVPLSPLRRHRRHYGPLAGLVLLSVSGALALVAVDALGGWLRRHAPVSLGWAVVALVVALALRWLVNWAHETLVEADAQQGDG